MPIHAPRNASAPAIPGPDAHDIASLSDRLLILGDELAMQVPEVAKARTVREFVGEQRKRALALAVREFLADESATAAETKGRASVAYGEALERFRGQYEDAEHIIAQHDATRALFEACRSVLSSLKQIAGQI